MALIEREAALEILENCAEYYSRVDDCTEHTIRQCISAIKKIAVEDAAPVVYGRWRTKRGNYITGGGDPLWECSRCEYIYGASLLPPKYHFCPNCGARMGGEGYEAN